jgi:hypothetical protein
MGEAAVEMYANRDISQVSDSYDLEFCAKVHGHASNITSKCLENRTEVEHQRFVPLALLFPIARRYWESKPVAHRAKTRNIKTNASAHFETIEFTRQVLDTAASICHHLVT